MIQINKKKATVVSADLAYGMAQMPTDTVVEPYMCYWYVSYTYTEEE